MALQIEKINAETGVTINYFRIGRTTIDYQENKIIIDIFGYKDISLREKQKNGEGCSPVLCLSFPISFVETNSIERGVLYTRLKNETIYFYGALDI